MQEFMQAWTIFDHYSSTIENPLHSDCPKGPKSWCSYQYDKVLGISTYVPPKNALLEAVVRVLTSIFYCHGNQCFLEECKNVSNQNANE